MFHQILGIRKFVTEKGEEKKYDAFHDKNWKATSLADLFNNLDKHLENIPENDRWNIFYTIAKCGAGKREFKELDIIAWDFDKIDIDHIETYEKIVLEQLELSRTDVAIVHSGNGLHVLVQTNKPIKSEKELKEKWKQHYKAIIFKINHAIAMEGLPGNGDPSIFNHRAILRLPGTENRKPGKPNKQAVLVLSNLHPVNFDLARLSGLPAVEKKDQIPQSVMTRYPNVDVDEVEAGCSFMKYAKDNPGELSEPQWYAALSILARSPDGNKLCHQYSSGHQGYSHSETEMKIEQALQASGPRTCENISSYFSECSKCPNFGKVKSPIQIRGKDAILTEHTGFHQVTYTQAGDPRYKPCADDLRKYYDREHPYVTIEGSRMVHTWDGTQYTYTPNDVLEGFAHKHFDPVVTTKDTKEFAALMGITNLKNNDWMIETTDRFINFENGVLNIDTQEFLDHDPNKGFKYTLPYPYDPSAKAPTFSKMIDRITGNDKDVKQLLLEYMGYCLSNDSCWAQKAMVLLGDGSNGKSTLIEILRMLAGEGNYSSLSVNDIKRSEYSRHMLDGKLFNACEETPTKSMLDCDVLKNLITGGECQVRLPYKGGYFIRNKAKILFICNELPLTNDNTWGFYRRFFIIRFKETFSKKDMDYDPHILEKMKQELPGIFTMAYQAYLPLKKTKTFTLASQVEKELEAYKIDTDNVARWIDENTIVHEDPDKKYFVTIADLYNAYAIQMTIENEEPINKNTFSKKLVKLIPGYEKRKDLIRDRKEVKRGLWGVEYGSDIGLASKVIPINRPGAAKERVLIKEEPYNTV